MTLSLLQGTTNNNLVIKSGDRSSSYFGRVLWGRATPCSINSQTLGGTYILMYFKRYRIEARKKNAVVHRRFWELEYLAR